MTHTHKMSAGGGYGQAVEVIPGDEGAAFLLGHNPVQSSDYANCAPKKYLLKTGTHSHSWRGADGEIHGTLSLIPI